MQFVPQPTLPPDWIIQFDERNNPYYVHTPTGHTQWEFPIVPAIQPQAFRSSIPYVPTLQRGSVSYVPTQPQVLQASIPYVPTLQRGSVSYVPTQPQAQVTTLQFSPTIQPQPLVTEVSKQTTSEIELRTRTLSRTSSKSPTPEPKRTGIKAVVCNGIQLYINNISFQRKTKLLACGSPSECLWLE